MQLAKVTRIESPSTLQKRYVHEGSQRTSLTRPGYPPIYRLGITAGRCLRLQCTNRNMSPR